VRFAQFFENDAHFMNEVVPAFGAAALVIIGSRRCAATDELTGDVPAQPRVGQCVHELSHANGKIQKPLAHVIRRHSGNYRQFRTSANSILKFSFFIFHFSMPTHPCSETRIHSESAGMNYETLGRLSRH